MSDRTLPVHAPSPPAPGPDPRRWWALILLCLAQFMVILDITVVNVALPTIGSDLQLDRAWLTWVVTAYTLCFGGLLLLGGRLADTLGRRRTFLAGLGLFTAASLASGLAQGGTALVAARAGQGVGAALLSPAALAIITTTFQGAERNRALGTWAAIAGAGAAVGVLAGGLLVEYASWRWVFYINLPVGILVAAAVPALIAAVRPGHRAARLDLLGALAGTLATAAVIYGLVAAGSQGWGATTTLLPLATGLVLAGEFVAVERMAREPLVPLELLARRPLLAGQLVMLASSGLLLATYFLSSPPTFCPRCTCSGCTATPPWAPGWSSCRQRWPPLPAATWPPRPSAACGPGRSPQSGSAWPPSAPCCCRACPLTPWCWSSYSRVCCWPPPGSARASWSPPPPPWPMSTRPRPG
jgi:MFS family permease